MLAVRFGCALGLAALLASATARSAEPKVEARRLYAEGKAEYAQGHYAEAIALFERSYALSESSALLFNMAQAHRLAGPAHCSDAVALYKSYLAAEPAVENRKEVEERIAELGDCSGQKEPETPAASQPARAEHDGARASKGATRAARRATPFAADRSGAGHGRRFRTAGGGRRAVRARLGQAPRSRAALPLLSRHLLDLGGTDERELRADGGGRGHAGRRRHVVGRG
jgi:hypothetical protein